MCNNVIAIIACAFNTCSHLSPNKRLINKNMRGLLRVYIVKYQIVACFYWSSIRSCYTRINVNVRDTYSSVSFVSSCLPSIVGEHNISEQREIVYRSIEILLQIVTSTRRKHANPNKNNNRNGIALVDKN